MNIFKKISGGLLLLSLIAALLTLTYFESYLDESNWILNGKLFLNAISKGDLANTYIGSDALHPGVTILWISAFVHKISEFLSIDSLTFTHRLFYLGLSMLILYACLKLWLKFSNLTLFLLSLVYLSLNPNSPFLGNITWLDLILDPLILLCILIWIEYLKKRAGRLIYAEGILLGLAVLTKFMAGFILPMIVFIGLIYSQKKRISYKYLISPLITIIFTAIFTFILFYPAMWVSPQRVLFSRFSEDEGAQIITLQQSVNLLPNLIQNLFVINPIIHLGTILVLMNFFRKKYNLKEIDFIAVGGLIYTLCLYLTIIVLYDRGRGATAFLDGLGRYILPSLYLFTPFIFYYFIKLNVKRLLKLILFASLFAWEIIQLRLYYPIS